MPMSPPQHRPAFAPSKKQQRLNTHKEYNRARRDQASQKFYNSGVWRRVSKYHKKLNPFCIRCYSKGYVVSVQVTDHIVPISQGGSKLDLDNLQSLCISCHNTKTAEEIKSISHE